MVPKTMLALTALLLVLVAAAQGRDLVGRVVGIADGDTFTLLTPEKQALRVRLAEDRHS